MSIVKKIKIDGKEILFFGTVKGLVSERDSLRKVFEDFVPDMVMVSMSPEEMEGLEKYLKEPFEIDPDDYEVIYAKKLERFGEVGLPVPTYLELFSLLKRYNFDIVPIDMPDMDYTELFTRKIDVIKLIRFELRKRKVWKKEFKAKTPEEFAIEWDKEINRIREFMDIERERERYMAMKIRNAVNNCKNRRCMVILEVERMEGVLGNLLS